MLRFVKLAYEKYKDNLDTYVRIVGLIIALPMGPWAGFQLYPCILNWVPNDHPLSGMVQPNTYLIVNIVFCFLAYFSSLIVMVKPGKWTFHIWTTVTLVSLLALWFNWKFGSVMEETRDKLFWWYIGATCVYCLTMTFPLFQTLCCLFCGMNTCLTSGGDYQMYQKSVGSNKPFNEFIEDNNNPANAVHYDGSEVRQRLKA